MVLIIIAIGFVLTFEAMNTALEYVVDLITDEYHELAKKAKDTAAASVMLASLIALVIGLIVFTIFYKIENTILIYLYIKQHLVWKNTIIIKN